MLTRKKQFSGKIETTAGVAEFLSAADAKVLMYDPRMTFDPEFFERRPAGASISRLSKIPGKRPGANVFQALMRGSGTATTRAEWIKYLLACGFTEHDLYAITIGAITSGPFQHLEVITGSVSEATGLVVKKTSNGTTTLYYIPVSGTLASGDTITGATSGATATAGGAPSQVGLCYRITTIDETFTNIPTMTQSGNVHGVYMLLKGCMGKVKFGLKSGKPVTMDFEFNGVEAGITDVAMVTGIVHEKTIPPVFMNAAFKIDSYAAKFSEMDIDVANTLAARDDPADSRGIHSFIITDHPVSGSYNPEMVEVATHDFYGKWLAGTEMDMVIPVGSVPGNKFELYAPRTQYTNISDEDRDGIAVAKSQFDFNGSEDIGDDEFMILAL
jgi:hypothetical protein